MLFKDAYAETGIKLVLLTPQERLPPLPTLENSVMPLS